VNPEKQRIEMALELAELNPASVPINFLTLLKEPPLKICKMK
jgi:biotin synthase-like enzyme